MPLRSLRSSDQRQAFAGFLEGLASTGTAGADWADHVVAHYADDQLEAIRRKVVRLVIERDPGGHPGFLPSDREQFRSFAHMLRSSAVS
jgi:hypothetical protein